MKEPDSVIFCSIGNLGEVSIQDRVTNRPQLHNKGRVLSSLRQVFDLWKLNHRLSYVKSSEKGMNTVPHHPAASQGQPRQLIALVPRTFSSPPTNCPDRGGMDTTGKCLPLCCRVQLE